MQINKKKIFKLIVISVLLISILIIVILSKNIVLNLNRNAENKYTKKQGESEVQTTIDKIRSEIQAIIDEIKEEIQRNEGREATLLDLKNKLYQKGYTLNEKTKEIYYNDHIVRINEDLTISTIDKLETNVSCTIQKDNADDYVVLVTIENPNGLDEIIYEDTVIKCNETEKIGLDKQILKEVGSTIINVKSVGKDYYEKYTIIPTAERMIQVANFDTLGDGTTKTIKINKLENEYISTHYSMDDGSKWEKYEEQFDVLEIDYKTIAVRIQTTEGKIIYGKEPDMISLAVGDSLISATGNAIMEKDDYYRIAVKDIEYNVHMYVENEDTVIEKDIIYGDQNDVATASSEAKNMVIVKVKGNLTVNEGVTVGPYYSTYGGPKGFLVYCTETLTNNGIIQNNYGAKASGQNVYLWYNELIGNFEFIPPNGAAGGAAVTSISDGSYGRGVTGNKGRNANEINILSGSGKTRATAGGAAGGAAAQNAWSNQPGARGGNGTSYSGGGGGGGTARHSQSKGNVATPSHANLTIGGNGSIIDGSFDTYKCATGGGAGCNPGYGRKSSNGISYENGSIGSGGLLIIYANNLEINSSTLFSASGAKGGNAVARSGSGTRGSAAAGGGGSGGGSINIFAQKIIDNTNDNIESCINVNGGAGGTASGGTKNGSGGAGGTGSCNIGTVNTGDYESFYSNY